MLYEYEIKILKKNLKKLTRAQKILILTDFNLNVRSHNITMLVHITWPVIQIIIYCIAIEKLFFNSSCRTQRVSSG